MKRMGARAFYEREQHEFGWAALLLNVNRTADERMPRRPNAYPIAKNIHDSTGMDRNGREKPRRRD